MLLANAGYIGGGKMYVFIGFMVVTGVSLILTLKHKKSFFLAIPFLSLLVYFVAQVALVPVPFLDTVKFIFSLS
jgi:hypothetical protein